MNITKKRHGNKKSKYNDPKDVHKNSRLLRMYGISLDNFNDMFELQKGVCKICGMEGKAKGLQVDHCHVTGKVRGLLCVSCNTMLGKIERNPSLLLNMKEYLNND